MGSIVRVLAVGVLWCALSACGGGDDDPMAGIDAAAGAADAPPGGSIDSGDGNPPALACAFPQAVSMVSTMTLCDLRDAQMCRIYSPVVFPTPRCETTDDGADLEFFRNVTDNETNLTAGPGWTITATTGGTLINSTLSRVADVPSDTEVTVTVEDATSTAYELVFELDTAAGTGTITSFTAQ